MSVGGKQIQCGWLNDQFGVSWQIVPSILGELLSGSDQAGTQRVMSALMTMTKLDIETLMQAQRNGAEIIKVST